MLIFWREGAPPPSLPNGAPLTTLWRPPPPPMAPHGALWRPHGAPMALPWRHWGTNDSKLYTTLFCKSNLSPYNVEHRNLLTLLTTSFIDLQIESRRE